MQFDMMKRLRSSTEFCKCCWVCCISPPYFVVLLLLLYDTFTRLFCCCLLYYYSYCLLTVIYTIVHEQHSVELFVIGLCTKSVSCYFSLNKFIFFIQAVRRSNTKLSIINNNNAKPINH